MNVDVGRSPLSRQAGTNLLSDFLQQAEQVASLAPQPARATATASTTATSTSPPNPATHLSTTPTSHTPSDSALPSMGSEGYGGAHGSSSSSRPHPRPAFTPETTPVPEKCFSWCSQRAEDTPMCRMFCLRMRQPLPSQKEQLSRLQGSRHDEALGVRSSAEQEAAAVGVFGRMKRALAPYSIIVLKGTTEGIAGRYMEELERDDGNYDFGHVSRNAPDRMRRNGPQGMHYQNWGPAGYMLYLPLTSIFSPIVNLPENMERIFGPPVRMLQRVATLTQDGAQLNFVKELGQRIVDGRQLAFLQQLNTYVSEKNAKRLEEEKKKQEMIAEKAQQQIAHRGDPRYDASYHTRLDPYAEQKIREVKASEEAARVAKEMGKEMGKEKENEK